MGPPEAFLPGALANRHLSVEKTARIGLIPSTVKNYNKALFVPSERHGTDMDTGGSSVDDGRFISRPYTPTKVTRSLFEVPIKIVSDGRLSLHIRHWKVGDEIQWRGPYSGDVIWSSYKVTRLLLVAGGVGIAPFIRVVEELLKDEDTEVRVRLVYCVRHGSDILFKELLSHWAHHWNVKIVIFGANVEKSLIHHLFGHVAARLDQEHFHEELRALCGDDLDQTAVGVCGRPTLEKDVVNFAIKAGVERLKIQRFLA